jgi:hypothetical protein
MSVSFSVMSSYVTLTMQAVLHMSAGVPYPAPNSTSIQRYCRVWISSVKWWYCNIHNYFPNTLKNNISVVCGIYYFACLDEFFANNPLDVKENYEHTLDFALHLFRLFRYLLRFSLSAYLITDRISVALFPRFASKILRTLAAPLVDLSQNCIRPDTRLQLKRHQKFCTLTPQYMIVPSYTIPSHYYNCYTDGSTSPGNYGYLLVLPQKW